MEHARIGDPAADCEEGEPRPDAGDPDHPFARNRLTEKQPGEEKAEADYRRRTESRSICCRRV